MGIDMPTCGSVGVWHYLTRLLAFLPDLSVCCLQCPSASISGFKKWGMKVSCAVHSVVTNSRTQSTCPSPVLEGEQCQRAFGPSGRAVTRASPVGPGPCSCWRLLLAPGQPQAAAPCPPSTSPAHRAPAWVAQPLGTCVPSSPSGCPQHRAGAQCPWSPVLPGQRLPKSPHVTVPWDF